jgi:hypothetical protein
MKCLVVGIAFALTAQISAGQSAPHIAVGIVSDWTHHHVLYPASNDPSVTARIQKDPRWLQDWYIRHPEFWWPEFRRAPEIVRHHFWPRPVGEGSRRDWSVPLGTASFEPLFDGSFTFAIGSDTGYGSLTATDQGSGTFLATAGTLTVTGTDDGNHLGAYSLYPDTPPLTPDCSGDFSIQYTSPNGGFCYNDLVYPSSDPVLDEYGLLFINSGGFEINIWGNSANNYSFYGSSATAGQTYDYQDSGAPFTLNLSTVPDPGAGQTFPAKYVFDVTAAPSCTNDFVVIGLPATPASGGQANILGLNNLYSDPGGTGYCPGTGPTVTFAYASGSGQVPASITLSLSGTQIAYIENLPTSSYFHVLTIGTTGTNGTSATSAAVPGASGGNNAVDQRVLLSPDGGLTNQSSTNAPFIVYTPNDANDVAYATTYSTAGSGSGYLYKLSNIFNGSAAPTIVWSVAVDGVPSTPIYDSISNKVFFTDSNGRIDYVVDAGISPSVVYGAVVAPSTTSEFPVVVDSTNQMVYASFNSNGTDAIIVQAPTSMASAVSVPVGAASTAYTSPYAVDFNNAWYTGSGTPLMYVAGTGSGTLPTLYSVGFDSSGVINASANAMAALATGTADSSPLTEFYNSALGKDYLFVGVTNNCIATTSGGTGGCVMSLDITAGFPTVNANSTALAAAGGASGIIVDNNSSLTQASSIYFATKTGATLVKATQAGLN